MITASAQGPGPVDCHGGSCKRAPPPVGSRRSLPWNQHVHFPAKIGAQP